ncbi:MAG: hypothetical protein ACI9SF_000504, partial [Candidatus Nanohaloarchaea archaeon]
MADYAVENLSELRLNDGSGNDGLVLDDHTISGEGGLNKLRLDYPNGEWEIQNSNLSLNGNNLKEVGNLEGSDIVNQDNIADGAVGNAELEDDSVTYSSGNYLTGGGKVSLGGSATLNVDPSTIDWSDTSMNQWEVNVSDLGAADSNLNMNSNVITGLPSPADSDDAVPKSYVDSNDENTNLGETDVEQYVFDNDNDEGDLGLGNNNIDGVSGIYSDDSSSNFFGSCASGEYVESINADGSVNCATDDTGTTVDEQVAVDSGASPGYIGAGSGSGVLRTNSPITYTDNGGYVTLDIGTGGITSTELDETDSYSLDWSNLAIDQSDVTKSDVGLGNVRNVDLSNTAGSYLNYDTSTENFNVQAGSISWSDLNIAKSDVSPGDVGDAGLSTGSSISGSTYDGTTAYTWNVNWQDANDLGSGGTIDDFSAADDLDSSGNVVNFDQATDLGTNGEITDNSVGNGDIDNSVNIDLGSLDVAGGSVGDGTQSGFSVDSNGNIYFDGSLNFPGDVNTINAQQLNGSIIPDRDADQNIGSSSMKWNNAYFAGDVDVQGGRVIDSTGQLTLGDGSVEVPNGGLTVSGNIDVGGVAGCDSTQALLGDGSCGATSDPTSLSGGDGISPSTISDGDTLSVAWSDANDLDSNGNINPSSNLDLNNNNLTDSGRGNVTINQDLKVYGTVWTPESEQSEGGSGITGSQNLSQVLAEGDVANQSIDMDNNKIENIANPTASNDAMTLGYANTNYLNTDGSGYMTGNLDLRGNNITDEANGNVTISQDLKVDGQLWLPGEGGSAGGASGLADVLNENNSAGGQEITDVGKIGTSGAVEIGSGTSTNNADQVVIGEGSSASGSFGSLALGVDANASESQAIAIGQASLASDRSGVAIGANSIARREGTALGYSSVAFGDDSYAIADNANASGSRSGAMGLGAKATKEGSVAIGEQAISNHSFTVTLGSLEHHAYDLRVTGDIYTNGADLAEFYQSPQNLEEAEVVAVDEDKENRAVRSSQKFQETAFGVVSTDPGQVMNTDEEKNGHPIALEGKVPVKVSEEN